MVSMLVDTCLGYVLMSFKLVFSTDNATSLGAAFRIRWGGCCGGCGNCVDRRGGSFELWKSGCLGLLGVSFRELISFLETIFRVVDM